MLEDFFNRALSASRFFIGLAILAITGVVSYEACLQNLDGKLPMHRREDVADKSRRIIEIETVSQLLPSIIDAVVATPKVAVLNDNCFQ